MMTSNQPLKSNSLKSSELPSGMKEECGVIAVIQGLEQTDDTVVAREGFYALFSLQHRGQEAAGMSVSNGSTLAIHRKLGLVNQAFGEEDMARLKGWTVIGHNRYSTTGRNCIENAQPMSIHSLYGQISLAHNGNLTNAYELRKELLAAGVGLSTTSDTEVMVMMLAAAPGKNWIERLRNCMQKWQGAYSVILQTAHKIYVARDAYGFRPLVYGYLNHNGILQKAAVASESCALRLLGFDSITDVHPGEIVTFTRSEIKHHEGIPAANQQAACVFEYIYFSRPDSVWQNISVQNVRKKLGRTMAKESPVEADVVIPVPDSSNPIAIGYSQQSNIALDEGLVKNRYIARTFIQPTDALRKQGVALKFSVMPHIVAGKRVIVIDDSIVRGNTLGHLVELLRKAGASEVHVRIASAPIRYPCYMGVDMGGFDSLLAYRLSVAEISKKIGADSLAYISYQGMIDAVSEEKLGLCSACFTGEYPIKINHSKGKEKFEATV